MLHILLIVSAGCLLSCASQRKTQPAQPVVESQPVKIIQDTVVPVKKINQDQERKSYTLRLLLPLRLKEHFANDTIPDQPLFYDNTAAALHFYFGAKAAVDSVKQLPIDLKVEVIDVSGDSLEVINKLRTKAFRGATAALSMLPMQYNEVAAKAAADAKCMLVMPGASNTQLSAKYPEVWMATPSNSTQLKMISDFLVRENAASEYLIFTRKVRSENVLSSFLAARIDSLSGKKVCREIEYNKDTWDATVKTIPYNRKLHVIIPTQDESYLQGVLNRLVAIDSARMFHLVGLPAWENFESVDPAELGDYSTTIFSPLYIDSEQPRAKKFRKAFVDQYHADPLPQAYQAFDLVYYLMVNYAGSGDKYSDYKEVVSFELPEKGMKFKQVCNGCGYENSTLNILQYGNFKLSRIAEYQR